MKLAAGNATSHNEIFGERGTQDERRYEPK
jgi:hypothetical protein